MKFVFFTDPHIRGTNPKARKDNFPETILLKLKEVISIAKEIGAKAIICGGDIFDRADPSPSVVKGLCEVLATVPNNIDFLSVIGNHDMFGQNPETIDRAMIGLVCSTGLIKRLHPEHDVIYTLENGDFVGILGTDSHYALDKEGRLTDYMPEKKYHVKVLINVVHGFLADRGWSEEVHHTLIENILDTPADITLTGHEHAGFGVIKRKGKIFCNPGALGRVSASMSEMNRIPSVAIVTIKSKDNFDVEVRPIEIAKASSEVLDREELEKEIEKKKNMHNFMKELEGFDVEYSNVYNIVDSIADKDKLPQPVKDEARKRLIKAEQELSGEDER